MPNSTKTFAKDALKTMIIKEPKKLSVMSLDEIARELNYSEAAIVKGLKSLGYTGLKDLKKELINENKIQIHTAVDSTNLLIQSILATDRSLNDTKVIDQFISRMGGAKVIIQGFGDLNHVAKLFAKELWALSIPAYVIEFKEEMNIYDANTLIILSTRGKSELSHEIIDCAKRKKLSVFAITDMDNSITEKIDMLIPFIQFRNSHDDGAMTEKHTLIGYVISKILIEWKK